MDYKKWIKRWQEEKLFEPAPDRRKKFFGTFPYPYVNSYLHLGHFYSSMRLEALSRFKRMQGFNVLYAQGWHCTGSPIVSAAKRIADKEPKQLEILRMQGFSEKEIREFVDPKRWVEYFPSEAKKDFTEMGYSIDWRRSFITTELNPHYDKFIRWQFRKLKEKGYVTKGKFPVVWDPVDNNPVGDHDRIEGEGETPLEYVLIKHKMNDKWIVSATLRPDTIMGVTNLYVNPRSELVGAEVDGETWIVSERVANELQYQEKKVKIIKKISGKNLIGKKVEEFSDEKVLILPASFVDTNVGTGIVHSVPSDSADDLIALYDLQNDDAECKKFGLDFDEVKKIVPIPVLEIPGYGKIPADDVIRKLGIKSQHDKEKLQNAKDLLYKDGFYKGKLNRLYAKKFSTDLHGKPVQEVKEQIRKELTASEYGDIYYQLTGKVVARTLAECVVKIVDDQWFMAYGDEKWKKAAHECLDKMVLYPEKTRTQFDYVIDWLRNWACTREFGLGTKLPWDEKWLIESLSDSTIYMAFYTISHKLKGLDPADLEDGLFDYIFLGKNASFKADKKIAKELQEEFSYWYPMDFRTTGKDLIQNHMSFCIFNHTAIFPKKHWPKAFGLNGHVMVDGVKMSKSRGNFITMRQAYKEYGPDASRFTALSGGEGIDDANFDTEQARSMGLKLQSLLEFSKENYNTGVNEERAIDRWMTSQLNSIIKDTTEYIEQTMMRSALQRGYFDLQRALKWYMGRTKPNKRVLNQAIETQCLLLAPFTPFVCEEIWESIGKKGLVAAAQWPKFDEKKIDAESQMLEDMISSTVSDINNVLKIVKIDKPKNIQVFVAPSWKYSFLKQLKSDLGKTRNAGELIKTYSDNQRYRQHMKEIISMITKSLKTGSINDVLDSDTEYSALKESEDFFAAEFSCTVHVLKGDETKEPKAMQAMPGKVAILVS